MRRVLLENLAPGYIKLKDLPLDLMGKTIASIPVAEFVERVKQAGSALSAYVKTSEEGRPRPGVRDGIAVALGGRGIAGFPQGLSAYKALRRGVRAPSDGEEAVG